MSLPAVASVVSDAPQRLARIVTLSCSWQRDSLNFQRDSKSAILFFKILKLQPAYGKKATLGVHPPKANQVGLNRSVTARA
jgi:hypothetical protein